MDKRIIVSDCLSTDRIHQEYDEDLVLCPICTNILWKPVACKTCENSFCLNCIRLWLNEQQNKCPFNCYFQERKPPGILLKILSKLKFDCENKSDGCDLFISYEALEKHQTNECLFRTIQCLDCSKEMFFKDLEIHEKESCQGKQINCLKCSTNYLVKEGHTETQCLQKQISIIELNINRSGLTLNKTSDNFQRLTQLYTKLLLNEDYAKKIQLDNLSSEQLFPIPSAPFEESSLPEEEEKLSTETLRISTVNFNQVNIVKKEGDHIPNGYAGFNWENAHSMSEKYVKEHYQLKSFLNSFTNSIQTIAFNGRGKSLSIYLPNPSNKFSFHSFQSISIYHQNIELSIIGYRLNNPIFLKHIILTNQNSQLFQMDFKQIDKITLTPTGIDHYTLKPQTFALIYLNFIL